MVDPDGTSRWSRSRVLIITLVISVIGLETGCISKRLEKSLEADRASVVAQRGELAALNRSGNTYKVDWKTAVNLLDERNLSLRQSRDRLKRLQKTRDEQWKTWVPRLGVYASVLSSLAELGTLGTSDLNASVIAPLNIPNPLTEQAQAYANALSYLEAKDSSELNYRRQVVTLYRIFSRYEALLARKAPVASNSGRDESIGGALGKMEGRASHEEMEESLQASLAQILNLPGKSPVPVPQSRPKLDYRNRIHSLDPGKNYGQLAVRLSAYQIEAAVLREKGVKLSEWPTAWGNATTPAIYNTESGDNGNTFDVEQVSLFAGLSKSYDITGREADGIKTAKENTEFVKQNLRLRLDQESREWIRLRRRYEQLQTKQKLAEERLLLVQQRNRGSALADLNALRKGQDALASIEVAKEQLELEVWVWDDDKWN